MSGFDADAFLNQEIDANFETEYTPVPEGEFAAQVKTVKVDSYTPKQGDDAGVEKPLLKINWSITDQEVAEETGIENPVVQQTVFLDYKDGVLETGPNKNITLGKLRELAGMEGRAFSMGELEGTPAVVRVKHRLLDDGRPMAEVKGIAELD